MGLPPIPPPNTLTGIDDLIRSNLETFREACFNWLLIATGLVVIGLLFEAPEIWHETFEAIREMCHSSMHEIEIPAWMKLFGMVGWFLIVAGVAGEFVADTFVSRADGYVQKFDEILLAETIKNAGDARDSARKARSAATDAGQQSVNARNAASNALAIAKGARLEADSFEADIGIAKQQASEAKSQIADAFTQATEATAELNRLKAPRTLINVSALVSMLRPFKGTEYAFLGVFSDPESTDLLKQIDSALQLAGWTRTKLPPKNNFADIGLSVFPDVSVPMTVASGISVKAQSADDFETLRRTPQPLLPAHIRGAMVLKAGLASAISPTQEDLTQSLDVGPGNPNLVLITVGKKP